MPVNVKYSGLSSKEAGKVGNGETIEFPISAGQHSLSLKIDWCGSNTIQFTVLGGSGIWRVWRNEALCW